jgi:hypothetical protein
MFDNYRRRTEEIQELDLLPVMNLFMVLIPFLLMGAAFFKIGVIPSSIAAHVPDEEAELPPTDRVTLHLIVKPDSLEISASNPAIDPAILDTLFFERRGPDADLPALTAHLAEIKRRFPASDTLIVLPYDELGFERLVGILDATRERQVGTDERGDPVFQDLFPGVVFSRFVETDVETAAAEHEGTGTTEGGE